MMPGNPDERSSSFRIGNGLVARTSEVLSFIDQRPYKDIVKTYTIKFDQTIGPAISTKSMVEIAERELKLYESLYADQNAKTIERKIIEETKQVIANLQMVYDDVDEGMQAVQVKIIITFTSKFHQVFTGPEKDLDSQLVIDYFKSSNVKSGHIAEKGTMNEDWRRIESPLSLFAVKIPQISAPYFMQEPTVFKEKDNKMEKIGMVFTDPIWSQKLFYNITGYQLESEMSFDLAEKALLEKHFKRHGRSMVGMKLRKDFIGETPYIEANYAIKPPEGYPYVNFARVRGMFLGNYMIVQEVVGPRHLVDSNFTNSFFDLVEFTPKQAFQKEIQRHMDFGRKQKQVAPKAE
ncbi:MAG: hypothetical protein GW778_04945 [Alphaproteobacteria bacterium]|nr:hypothetical protein [Alphaproteobacteria bacterium]